MHVTIIIIGESVNAPLQKRHSPCCVVSASSQSDTATPVVSLWSCNHRCLCETGTEGPEGGGEGEAEGGGKGVAGGAVVQWGDGKAGLCREVLLQYRCRDCRTVCLRYFTQAHTTQHSAATEKQTAQIVLLVRAENSHK